jgi:3-dehydroquinate synthase
MVLAAKLSADLGRAPRADAERLAALLRALGLPVMPPACDPQRLLALMRLDKKNLSGRLRLILWRGIGSAEIVPDIDDQAILRVLEAD